MPVAPVNTAPPIVRRTGLRIKNQDTPQMQEKKLKEQYKQKLDQNVEKVLEAESQNKKEGSILLNRFWGVCNDKTVSKNKTEIQKSVEKELIANLTDFAFKLNNDPTQQDDGMGSVVVLMVLIKAFWNQKDRINDLEYEMLQLKSDKTRLTREIDALKSGRVSTP